MTLLAPDATDSVIVTMLSVPSLLLATWAGASPRSTRQLCKLGKDKAGVVTRERLTKAWTDGVDYWAVDFDYMSRKEMIQVQRGKGLEGTLPGIDAVPGELAEFESRWTGGFIFENERAELSHAPEPRRWS